MKNDIEGAVSSSEQSTRQLKQLGIPVLDLNSTGPLSLYVDGADECDPHNRLIKGGGGALTREKIIAQASAQFVCIIDASKQVDVLGKFPLPVEVIPMARSLVAREIVARGGQPVWREGVVTDNGNWILDVHNLRITDPVALDAAQEAAGQLRFEIEAAFSQGLPNTPMANATVRVVSGNFLTARPVGIVDGIDFMHSGLVRRVDSVAIRRAIDGGAIVLLSPFGFSPTGEAFNLTMEDVATSTAIALQADKLVFMTEVPGLRVMGPAAEHRGGLVSFTLDGVHPHDVATVLDQRGVCVRAGHHCAMPLHELLGVPASARASFHCYSLREDVDALVTGLHETRRVFGR